jgi:hypothetical protein
MEDKCICRLKGVRNWTQYYPDVIKDGKCTRCGKETPSSNEPGKPCEADGCASFGKAVLGVIKESVGDGSGDETIYELANLAVKHKLIEHVPYNEEKHGMDIREQWDVEEGDMIYWWGGVETCQDNGELRDDFIVYTSSPDNCREVAKFIGDVPPCPICQDHGEYEDNGPRGCQPCNSRCLPLVDYRGKRVYVDWGDRIERQEDGLHLIVST